MARRRRVVIYGRISRTTAESVSLARQTRDLVKVCELEEWDVVATITDDGHTGTKERSEANRALAMLRSGEADTLLVWAFDRWSRQGFPAVTALLDTLKTSKNLLFYAHKDGLRSDRAAWRMVALVLAEVAAMESENARDRIRAARAFHLSQTEPERQRFLGSRPPFGYRAVSEPPRPGKFLIPDEYEASIAVEVAELLADKVTLGAVTKWLADRRVPTPQSEARRLRQSGVDIDAADFDEPLTVKTKKGTQPFRGAWRATTVRNLWRSETLLGRTTKAEPVIGNDGEPILNEEGKPKTRPGLVRDASGLPIARWAPILDAELFARLQARFKAPGREQPRRMASWLTGVLYCQECGRRLYAHRRDRDDRDASYFRCAGVSDVLAPCPAPARVSFSRVEAYIEAHFLSLAGAWPELEHREYLDAPDVAQRVADVERAVAEVTAALGRNDADESVLMPRLRELKEERIKLASIPSTLRVESVPTGRTLGDIWAASGDDVRTRRDVLSSIVERVYVGRPDKSGRPTPLDPEHVRIQWDAEKVPTHDIGVFDDSNALVTRRSDGTLTLSPKASWIVARAEEALALEDASEPVDPDAVILRDAIDALVAGDTAAARVIVDILELDVFLGVADPA